MEQIIEAFGLDVRLIIAQVVNFAVLMGVLGYFLYNPILKLLREREEKISGGIKDAEAAAAALANAEEEKRSVLALAHDEAGKISERARSHAATMASEAAAAAQAKAQAILTDAEARAEAAKRRAEKESEAEIAKLAVLAAEKILMDRA